LTMVIGVCRLGSILFLLYLLHCRLRVIFFKCPFALFYTKLLAGMVSITWSRPF
jgi:hypothetical protein